MTSTLLARDRQTGALGSASAIGNVCAGAWVLRWKPGVGVFHFPSTLWGENVASQIAKGENPELAVRATTDPDAGRAAWQLLVLDCKGDRAAFSGSSNVPHVAKLIRPEICAGGNMLSQTNVISALVDGYSSANGNFIIWFPIPPELSSSKRYARELFAEPKTTTTTQTHSNAGSKKLSLNAVRITRMQYWLGKDPQHCKAAPS